MKATVFNWFKVESLFINIIDENWRECRGLSNNQSIWRAGNAEPFKDNIYPCQADTRMNQYVV